MRNLYAKTGQGFEPEFISLNVNDDRLELTVRSEPYPRGNGRTALAPLSKEVARDLALALLRFGIGEHQKLAPEGMSRRSRVDLSTPAERAIRDAVDVVERSGGSPLLTDAVNLLGLALDRVADHVEAGVR